MLITVISQAKKYIHYGIFWLRQASTPLYFTVLVPLIVSAGCMGLAPPYPERLWRAAPRLRQGDVMHIYWILLLILVILGGILLLAWLGYNYKRSAQQGIDLDREDLGLLRTARDAMQLLTRRQQARLRSKALMRLGLKDD